MFLKSTKFFLPISLGLLVFLTIFLLLPSSALAAIKLAIPIGGKTTVADLGDYLATFYKYFIGIVGILATVMIMFGGFRWITAAGSPEKIKEAKSNIMSAIIAVVLMLCSYLILRLINPALIDMTVPYIKPVEKIDQKNVDWCPAGNQTSCGQIDQKAICWGTICPAGEACDNMENPPKCKSFKNVCEDTFNPQSQADCDSVNEYISAKRLIINKVCRYKVFENKSEGLALHKCQFVDKESAKCESMAATSQADCSTAIDVAQGKVCLYSDQKCVLNDLNSCSIGEKRVNCFISGCSETCGSTCVNSPKIPVQGESICCQAAGINKCKSF